MSSNMFNPQNMIEYPGLGITFAAQQMRGGATPSPFGMSGSAHARSAQQNNEAYLAHEYLRQIGFGSNPVQEVNPFLDRNMVDTRDLARWEWEKQQQANKQRILGILEGEFKGTSGGGTQVNFGDIDTLLKQAQQQRNTIFHQGALGRLDENYRAGDVQSAIDRVRDLTQGADSQQFQALRGRGLAGLHNEYLTAQRGLRSLNDRQMPSLQADARAADLLKQRMRSRQDLEQGLILGDLDRRQEALTLLSSMLADDINRRFTAQAGNADLEYRERTQRLGNPELGAEFNLRAQEANAQRKMQLLSSLIGYAI